MGCDPLPRHRYDAGWRSGFRSVGSTTVADLRERPEAFPPTPIRSPGDRGPEVGGAYPRLMSVKVDLNQLATALDNYTFAYLITVGDDHHAHTVAVDPVLVDGVIGVGSIGNRTRRNLDQHDGVTLVWPPRELGGYTLIVDGSGQPTDAEELKIVPNRAVLHRPAASGAPTKPGLR